MNRSRFYPRVRVDTAAVPAVGQAGGVLLCDTVAAAGTSCARKGGVNDRPVARCTVERL